MAYIERLRLKGKSMYCVYIDGHRMGAYNSLAQAVDEWQGNWRLATAQEQEQWPTLALVLGKDR